MKLKVLGKYGPFPKEGGATSCYLITTDRNNRLLLDIGSGSFSRLIKEIKPQELDGIFISHFHADHVADMGILNYYLERVFGRQDYKKINVFLPNDNSLVFQEITRYKFFNFIFIEENKEYDFCGGKIKFYKMNHPVLTYGIKIYLDGKVFAYTGDSNVCDNLNGLFKDSNFVLSCGSFLHKDWGELKPHMSIEIACKLFEKYNTKGLITHINPDYQEMDILNEIAKFSSKVQIAQESVEYLI